MSYVIFWGCHIPARFTHLEYSMKKVLDAFGVDYSENERFSCCPENYGIKSLGHENWLLTAGRNLALAEAMGRDLLCACNGCYSSLKSAQAELSWNNFARDRLNQALLEFGLEYQGTLQVKHFLEFFYEEITPSGIKRRIKRPLLEIPVAVHPGCHLLSPSKFLRFDQPLVAKKFDQLVSATYAKPIQYLTKFLCCGGSFNYAGEDELSLEAVRTKLKELNQLSASAIITGCPSCYSQFDTGQLLLQRKGEKFNIPVLYYTELLGLGLGFSSEELALDRHRISVDSLLEGLKEKEARLSRFKGIIDLEMMAQCLGCSACRDDCPGIKLTNGKFDPFEIFKQILNGELEEVISGKQIWQCLDCYTCYELCGQAIGMNRFFQELRRLSVGEGLGLDSVKSAIDSFKNTGLVVKPSQSVRKRLGLKELKPLPEAEIKGFFLKLNEKKRGLRNE